MMAVEDPSVSVVIPVYNGELYLAEAIESALAQTCRPLETVVVDDGSTDGSLAVAGRYAPPVKVYSKAWGGLGAARNFGVERTRGEFIAFLDADDVWVEDKLECQLAAFEADAEPDMVFGQARQFVSPELDEAAKARLDRDGEILAGYFAGAMLIRRGSFARVGPFATHLAVGEFIDWYMRAVELGLKSRLLPQVVVHRRLHETNTTYRERRARTDYVRILKAGLDRRRARQAGG